MPFFRVMCGQLKEAGFLICSMNYNILFGKIEKIFLSIIGWLYIASIYVSTLKIYKKHSVEKSFIIVQIH